MRITMKSRHTQYKIRTTILALFVIATMALTIAPVAHSEPITLLHEFAGGADDGKNSRDSLIVDSGTLYGMTQYGGSSNLGTLFSMNSDGTGFTVLHSFTPGPANGGCMPYGNLTLGASTLYGMTLACGSGYGTIFSMSTDGTGFTPLHNFTNIASDGSSPRGSLTLDAGTLYGMTYSGGASNPGTVFSIGTDGTGFTLLHDFTGGANDGGWPEGSLVLDSGTLYGMTYTGGASNYGTVFSMGTDGTGFTLLHDFAGGAGDGCLPIGSLTLGSGTLYGMSYQGGNFGSGTAFSMNTDGTGFTVLHDFAGSGNGDGSRPRGDLTLDSGTLYGMTPEGGNSNNYGTLFSMSTDGTGYTLLHDFTGGVSDARYSKGRLTLDSGTLYGMTYQGGDSGYGTVFSLGTGGSTVPEFPAGAIPFLGTVFGLVIGFVRRKKT
ncbi:MAG: choice-of-anchor tandem repeat GloVer-containing protein [Candidatus Omnitrophota bacterium]|nr:choice-of-anchor tandem repeat GloVer-containing protein [Candidatus Omnitrophota bacterium]